MHVHDDTIAAIATAPGAAGLAVVRVSGSRALDVAACAFRGAALREAATHTLHHGWVVRPGEGGARIDEAVAAVFRAPRSYTREDTVELTCHGGRLSAAQVLGALLAAGARLAGPGEFSLRAFLNGRLDLAQAEAVADVIHAETEAARTLALSQLAGGLSRTLRVLADGLNDTLAEIEARVDFAEDVGGVEVPVHARAAIAAAAGELDALLANAAYARAVREGARVPIIGRPNAGKSSLFNALLGEHRSLVTDEPGTTRDRVSEAVELGGVRVVLSDTAGLRDRAGRIEALGIAVSEAALEDSPAALWVVDAVAGDPAGDAALAARLAGKRVVVALNKIDVAGETADRAARLDADLEHAGAAWRCVVPVSALRGDGLAALRGALLAALGGAAPGALAAAVSNARHVEALERARAALGLAAERAADGTPGEIVAIELREALAAIGEVTGDGVDPDLLDRIFGRFCIGK